MQEKGLPNVKITHIYMIKAFFFHFYREKCPKYKKINPSLCFYKQKGLKFEICSLFLMYFPPKSGFWSFFSYIAASQQSPAIYFPPFPVFFDD